MIALQGYYENGKLDLFEEPPVRNGKVFVIFTEDISDEKIKSYDLDLFEKFSGSITRIIDEKKELIDGLTEKYESIN